MFCELVTRSVVEGDHLCGYYIRAIENLLDELRGAVIQLRFVLCLQGIGIVLISDYACNLSLVATTEHRDYEGDFGFPLWRLTKRVQTIRHEISLQIIEILCKLHGEIIECGIIHSGQVDFEIVVKI